MHADDRPALSGSPTDTPAQAKQITEQARVHRHSECVYSCVQIPEAQREPLDDLLKLVEDLARLH